MEMAFWILVGLSVYSYLLFPISLFALVRIVRRPWKQENINAIVSVVISVYNEEKVIRQKIENALALDYPAEQLEITVISDGSTDDTEKIVCGFSEKGVVLRAFKERSGKTECLNRAIPEVRGDIVLFTDANSMFPRDTVKRIVSNFADPGVGLVTGWTRYGEADQAEDTTGIYSRFEKWTKIQESRILSCVGADGAVFAIRKEFFQRLRRDDINDFVIPLNVIRQGKRVVMDVEAYCHEKASEVASKEYQRQVRITNRTLRAIGRNIDLIDPFKYGFFAYFLFSHKVMRFLVPFFLISTAGTNIMLLGTSHIYSLTLGFQLAALAVAVGGALGIMTGRMGEIAGYFLITILAQLTAWSRAVVGWSDTMWTPQR